MGSGKTFWAKKLSAALNIPAFDLDDEIEKAVGKTIAEIFTEAGDKWRSAAVQAAGIYKGRIGSQADFDVMGDYLLEISEIEKKAFQALSKIKWNS